MLTPDESGVQLLLRYTSLLGTRNRHGALEFRNKLSTPQLEAFYRAMRAPWIPAWSTGTRTPRWVVQFLADDADEMEVLIRDLNLIAQAHKCSLWVEFDDNTRVGKLIFRGTTPAVRAIILAWARGYVRTLFDDYSDHDGAAPSLRLAA
ncbi:MAG: hypothetical protein M1546_00075 [Chloroflexi bacterium]|nr:hypothetical protein [Chloroflexota bacterium]